MQILAWTMQILSFPLFALMMIFFFGGTVYTIWSAFYILPAFAEGRRMTRKEMLGLMPSWLRKLGDVSIKGFLICLVLGLVLGLVAPKPRLTEAEVIAIAKQEAERNGKQVADYLEPKVKHLSDKRWAVSYEGRMPGPQYRFSVVVDDKTGKAEVRREW